MKKILFFASAIALLASCSKDMIEDVAAPSVLGDDTIIATYDTPATRVHLEGTSFAWDEGDGIGVFAADTKDATNAYFGFKGMVDGKPNFKGDLKAIKGNEFYAYYPYSYGTTVANMNASTVNVGLFIPATQYYNHDAGETGSFSPASTPAVSKASVEAKDGTPVEFKFTPVVAFVRVPMTGIGTVNTMTLQINTKDGDTEGYTTYHALNGKVRVDFEGNEEQDFTVTNPTDPTTASATSRTITLNCGEGVTLNRETPTYFWFVVPADMDLTAATQVVIKVNGGIEFEREYTANEKRTLGKGEYMPLAPKDATAFVWNDGGKVLIDNAEQLVEYLYLATYGWNSEEFGTDEAATAIKNFYLDGDILRTAVIMNNLVFNDETNKYQQNWQKSGHAAESAFAQDVYRKFNTEGENFAVTSVGGELAFNIENGTANKSVTVDGLAFAGSIFNDSQVKTSTVKDVTFVNTTVNADYFIAKTYGVTNLTLTNVTTGEGCVLVPVTEGKGAFVDAFDTKNGNPVETVLPTFDGEENIKYAHTLTVTKPANYKNEIFVVALDKAVAQEGELQVNTTDYNAITTATAGTMYVVAAGTDADGKNITVANVAKALIQNENFKVASKVWHSVVTRDSKYNVTASYWTGTTATTADNNDGVFTAEELAYVVSNRTQGEHKLTCNLTLSYKDWVKTAVAATDAITIDGNKKTISGAQIKATNTTAYNYTVFGYAANLKNITVNSTTIDFGTFAVPATANVAVLAAVPGENGIDGVTVGAPTIKVPAAAKVTTIGGMFATADATQWAAINGEKAVNKITTTATTTSTKNIANDAKFGSVVGKLTVSDDDTNKGVFTKTVTTDAVNKIVGKVDYSGVENETKSYFMNFGEGQYPEVANLVAPTKEAQVYVFHNTNVEEDVYCIWYPTIRMWVSPKN